jgi:hypothetical protein
MYAKVGDRLHIHTSHTGTPDQFGRIVEIRGANGTPPYVVEFPDGPTRLVFPGPDAVVEPAEPSGDATAHRPGRGRRMHQRTGW